MPSTAFLGTRTDIGALPTDPIVGNQGLDFN